jgi:assimilatory nitrate reductase catalytic subunit
VTAPIRTTCPYCGVGCGVLAHADGRISGDPEHPANFGRLCSKGSALAETLGPADRLLQPQIGRRDAGWDEALDLVAARFATAIRDHGPDSVAFYVSGQCLTEDYYVANKLMKGFIGSANIDTNSRLCMASSVAGHLRAFGADVVPGTYEDLEQADLVVLIGSNLAWCHPVLHQRLLAARAARGTRIVVVDPRRTASCQDADLHLALAPGSDVALFAGLLAHLADAGTLDRGWIEQHTEGFEPALDQARAQAGEVARITGLDPQQLQRFYSLFATTERTVTVFSQGVNQSSAGTDKVNAIINCHLATGRIGRPGAGPFSVTGQPNAMGGREVGGLANQLAAHMGFDRPADLDRVRRFWRAPNLATRPGLKAVELFDAVGDGRIKALWIIATNPADSMPRAGRVRAALDTCPFVVVSDCWPNATTARADVVLPAAGWGEKDGTVTNSERRISRQRAFRAPPGAARPDWWVLAEVARRLGWGEAFAWNGPAEIFAEHAALSAFENDGSRVFDLSGLDPGGYDRMEPVQWPVRTETEADGGRLFARGVFATPDGRARFVATVWRPPAGRPSPRHPLLLNTGRLRDQWHTMTRTGRVPRLLAHSAEPIAAIAPEDADVLGIEAGALVRITSAQGSLILRAERDPGQRPGEIFVPMHWTDQFSAAGPVGRLVDGIVDPVSGQPELKATPVTLEPVATAWRALLLHRRAVPPPAGCYWSRVPLAQGHALTVTGIEVLPTGRDFAVLVSALLDVPAGAERLDLVDVGRGSWRFAALVGGRLEACLFLALPNAILPPHDLLADLLGSAIVEESRPALLAARPATGPDAGPMVCTCFSVGVTTLRRAILADRLTSVEAIGAALGAGTNCGSCVPELKQILDAARVSAA